MNPTDSITISWLDTMQKIMKEGIEVSPRGKETLEIVQHTIAFDARQPVLTVPSRKLSYQFMAAEAFWIMTGDNRVETIAPYNKHIANFSDNGETFFGAYGPKILGQLNYVVNKLMEDPDSRQAGLTIWRENPPITKDIPCTIAMFFNIRPVGSYNYVNCHVFMRSSDVWLGIPYDAFNFSMIIHMVCAILNGHSNLVVAPGSVYITAASSHLYKENFEAISRVLVAGDWLDQPLTPDVLYQQLPILSNTIKNLRDSRPGDSIRWWEV